MLWDRCGRPAGIKGGRTEASREAAFRLRWLPRARPQSRGKCLPNSLLPSHSWTFGVRLFSFRACRRLPPRCALAARPFLPMLLPYYLTVLGPFTVRTDGHFPTVVSVSLLAMDADGFRVSLRGSRARPLLFGVVVFAFCGGAAVLFYPATYGHDIRNRRASQTRIPSVVTVSRSHIFRKLLFLVKIRH